jgi:hypothetical protein
MKDLRYLILLICLVVTAHVIRDYSAGHSQAKFLPDDPRQTDKKRMDTIRTGDLSDMKIIPASYNN